MARGHCRAPFRRGPANGGPLAGPCMLLTAIVSRRPGTSASGETFNRLPRHHRLEIIMANAKGPNIKKKQKCKNCEGKGLRRRATRW